MLPMERDESKPNFRQAGRTLPGKLNKGPLQDPVNKTTSASIPYKFETILYKNTNPKGFGTSSQRVLRNEDLGPGPGSYDYDPHNTRTNTTSYSKKGFGNGFVSQASRLLYRGYMNTGPGPGAYTALDKPFQVTHIVHDKNRDMTDEALRSKTAQIDLPGPGYYNPLQPKFFDTKSGAVFKSTTGRLQPQSTPNPPPGTYEVDRSLSQKKPFKHFLGSSTFMLPTTKKMSKEAEDKKTVNNLLGKAEDGHMTVPGPGFYFKTDKDDENVLFNQKIQDKNNFNFMIGNQTRFGEVIQRKVKRIDNPGPGTYIPIIPENEERTLVSGAVFMSETARKPFNEFKTFIGPTKYDPELLPKKSYHLNINKIWV